MMSVSTSSVEIFYRDLYHSLSAKDREAVEAHADQLRASAEARVALERIRREEAAKRRSSSQEMAPQTDPAIVADR